MSYGISAAHTASQRRPQRVHARLGPAACHHARHSAARCPRLCARSRARFHAAPAGAARGYGASKDADALLLPPGTVCYEDGCGANLTDREVGLNVINKTPRIIYKCPSPSCSHNNAKALNKEESAALLAAVTGDDCAAFSSALKARAAIMRAALADKKATRSVVKAIGKTMAPKAKKAAAEGKATAAKVKKAANKRGGADR